jgi:hypothetical protein
MPKPIEQFHQPDERWANIVTKHDQEAGILHLGRLSDLYDQITQYTFSGSVPEKVRAQFDLALNLYLHHWYVYDFVTMAEQQAYAALETALRHRYRSETGDSQAKPALGNLLEYAIAHKWVNGPEFEFDAPWHPKSKFSELEMMRMMRNNLAHGEFHLMAGSSYSALETCHYIITALFPVVPTAST